MFNALILAALPVALSITNAVDYLATVPVNSNLICGVGMGSGGAYSSIRAEDAEFLFTALSERLIFASDPFSGLFLDDFMKAGRLPKADDAFAMFSTNDVKLLDFRLSFNYENAAGDTFSPTAVGGGRSKSYGFVPAAWQPWTGYLKITGTNGWERNGYDASTDIRAVFDPSSSAGIPTNEIPETLWFEGALALQAITNSYALIEGDLFSTILRGQPPESSDVTTNENSLIYNSIGATYNYTTYTIGDYTGQYLSSVTLGGTVSTTNTSATAVDSSMSCHSEHHVQMTTPYGLEYSTAPTSSNPYPGGTIHVASSPFKSLDRYDESLPGAGGPWTVRVGILSGLRGSDRVVNTNLTIGAYLVCCWSCTTTDTFQSPAIPEGRSAVNITSNQVVRLLSSHELGSFEFSRLTTERYPVDIWEALTARLSDVQNISLNYASASRCFASPFFWRPTPPTFVVDPSELPATVSSGWRGASANEAVANATRRNDFTASHVYLLLVVTPTYYARVLE